MAREHGSHTCYVWGPEPGAGDGCRCEPCRAAASRYERDRTRRVAPAYVGGAIVRDHIALLRGRGIGVKTIAARAGISHGAISKIVYGDAARRGPSKRVRVETRDKILAVLPSDAADGARIPAGPTWANIDTLLARGWTKAAIGRAITGNPNVGALQLGAEQVQTRHARAVAALLDRPVPPRRSRHGEHPVDQPDDDEDQDNDWPIDLPRPPKVDLAAEPWRRHAACRMPDVPVWLFFPTRGDNETIEAAKAVCGRCSVRQECLDAHLDEREGVWGATSEHERVLIRRERRRDDESEAA